jgi:hypothetical protein
MAPPHEDMDVAQEDQDAAKEDFRWLGKKINILY